MFSQTQNGHFSEAALLQSAKGKTRTIHTVSTPRAKKEGNNWPCQSTIHPATWQWPQPRSHCSLAAEMLPGQEHFVEKQHPQSQSPWSNKVYAATVCFFTSGATNFSFLDFMTWEIQGVGVLSLVHGKGISFSTLSAQDLQLSHLLVTVREMFRWFIAVLQILCMSSVTVRPKLWFCVY